MTEHPVDDLHRLLDGRLDAEGAAQVEAHVAGCARCRREMEAVRAVKTALRDHLPQLPVPDHLAARIRAVPGGRTRRAWRRPVAVGAVLALAAAVALMIGRPRGGAPDIVHHVAEDFTAYRDGTMQLQLATAVSADLEQFFVDQRVPFETWVFEFDVMRYGLAGGSVVGPRGAVRALFAYESLDGDRMICEMYEGTTADLAGPTEVRTIDGIDFIVYRRGELTLVFWQDGALVCVLVADMDYEQAIVFAHAKATET